MYVFIDTNVFFGDWFTRSATFRYLFHFLNNSNHVLLISRLVIQETENLWRREVSTAFGNAQKAIAAIDRVNGSTFVELRPQSDLITYDLLTLLLEKADNVTIVEYDGIPQATVVERALKHKRPFLENEKGYRDTLIWLSLIEHIRVNNIHDEVAFITENSNDFFELGVATAFHSDLVSDLEDVKNTPVKPFASLPDFVNTAIDKNEHAIDYSKAELLFEEYLLEEATVYLGSTTSKALESLQSHLFPGTSILASLSGASAEVVEGIEDFYVASTNVMSRSEVYVVVVFDIRILEMVFYLPSRVYQKDAASLDGYDIEDLGDTTAIRTWIRPRFTVSFSFNQNSSECSGFSVSEFKVIK